MTNETKSQLMSMLFSQIEEAWRDRGDRTLVYQLAEKYPDFREQLYDFFDDLIFGDSADAPPAIEGAENRISHWLQSEGVEIGIAAARQSQRQSTNEGSSIPVITGANDVEDTISENPKLAAPAETWIAFLRQRLHQQLADIVRPLPNVNVDYLVLVSRHPNIVPRRVCAMIAAAVEQQWHVSSEESLRYLLAQPHIVRAASRSRPFEKEPATFKDLLDRSDLNQEQKSFWLNYAKVE